MAAVRVYVEGGGDKPEGKRRLQKGFGEFLREFREGRTMPSVHACGGRDRACRTFLRACQDYPEAFVVLLVDAEGPVACTPRAHLSRRDGDGWDLRAAEDDQVHLMVQAMEAWLIADRQALRKHYRADFSEKALPAKRCPGDIPKDELKPALRAAGGKRGYSEAVDGPAILKLLDPAVVRAKCPDCKRLFDVICSQVEIKPFADE